MLRTTNLLYFVRYVLNETSRLKVNVIRQNTARNSANFKII